MALGEFLVFMQEAEDEMKDWGSWEYREFEGDVICFLERFDEGGELRRGEEETLKHMVNRLMCMYMCMYWTDGPYLSRLRRCRDRLEDGELRGA